MRTPHVETVIKLTAKHFNMPEEILRDVKYRAPHVAYARHLSMYLARKHTFSSYSTLAKAFGVEHTSVLYAYHRIAGYLIDGDRDHVKGDINAITRRLKKNTEGM